MTKKQIVYHATLLTGERFSNVRNHPLFMQHILRYPPEGYNFTFALHQWRWKSRFFLQGLNRFIFGLTTRSDRFSKALYKKILTFYFHSRWKHIDLFTLLRFIRSRNIDDSLFGLLDEKNLIFFQTFPLTLSQQNWFIEIEDSTTLFFPFLENGKTENVKIQGTSFHKCIKLLLEDKNCKQIITHIKSTAESLPILFNSEIIRNKVRHLPVGIEIPKHEIKQPKNHINILFSNSWHAHYGGFYLRGGLNVIEAFKTIAKNYPNATLIIRSQLTDMIKNDLKNLIEQKRIHIIETQLNSDEWNTLKQECHIYLLPAARIHVVSLLEAMASGMAVICSDGWGFNEFIKDGENGFIVPGYYGKTSWLDPIEGALRENYSLMYQSSPEIVNNLSEKLSFLLEHPNDLFSIRKRAKQYIVKHHNIHDYRKKFKELLDKIHSVPIMASSENSEKKPSTPDVPFPLAFTNFVIDLKENGQLYVQSSEDYHTDNKNVLFSSIFYSDCLAYVSPAPPHKLRTMLSVIAKRAYEFLKKSHQSDSDTQNVNLRKIIYPGALPPFASTCVGSHPVFNFTYYPPSGYNFFPIDNNAKVPWGKRWYRRWFIRLQMSLFTIKAIRKGIPFSILAQFFSIRKLDSQEKMPIGSDVLVLYPTYPITYGQHGWYIEIEDMLTLMVGFANNGNTNPHLTKDSPIIKLLELLFESSNFKGVISHLHATAAGLKKLFQHNPYVARKIFHIPLAFYPLPPLPNRSIKPNPSQSTIQILFLNGWAQDPVAFYRRGGLNALESFSRLSKKRSDVTLILRSKIPLLDKHYINILEEGKQKGTIIHIENKISDEEMRGLYKQCDILLFPAVRIAVTTLLQAMAHSMVIVASDGFGIEEYVEDKVNGCIARGFYQSTGYIDDHGIFRENYLPALQANEEIVQNTVMLMEFLIENPTYMQKIQMNARKSVEEKFSIQKWNEQFLNILEEDFAK